MSYVTTRGGAGANGARVPLRHHIQACDAAGDTETGCAAHKCRLARWRKLIVMNRRSREWSIPGATRPGEGDRQRFVTADASARSRFAAAD